MLVKHNYRPTMNATLVVVAIIGIVTENVNDFRPKPELCTYASFGGVTVTESWSVSYHGR